ncbi:MAG: tetratricopeptide repeat protein [Gemmatimonadetes bacterium]|uniref:Tetratricopeptide repeat protein n=1 Tax=Candidatus Kutchimonas denitrificans TaxID=3056748 RepID=A0AAE5CC96_9BACT|nr:tetratricopeptide repeat protein [Gemmatimonadota bacterium]NIR75405.1 tetratricopeptide repeat protein [Candidatus Kutchimonas denitrificans]NIS01719.1 tetratricopeptide repeat protein [Gemmatimonadota bacterium]NIT67501.1 tetratricopeptide repeat protein [Gemmatimonadota bacterium]NIU53364.1 tetratricopeptide repeat protein [Gemmatimonadota bacterium]
MSERKRARARKPRQEEPSPPDTTPSRRGWAVGAAAVLVVAATVLLVQVARRGPDGGGTFPVPGPAILDTAASFEDFVGSDECEECHKAEYDAWERSTHGKAGGVPGDVRVIAPFDGVPIRFADAIVTPLAAEDGRLGFRVVQRDGTERFFEVAGVVGGGHMVGGGTQAFFSRFPDGTYRFLPFDYVRQEGVWFCQTAGRSNQGWTPIRPDMALSDCNDWPPVRVLGSYERLRNCQNCHGSQIVVRYDFEEKRYRTRFTTLAINCESCHGPGRRHIEIADSDSIDRVTDIGVEALATLDKDGSLGVCFQCHAVKAQLRPGFISGRPLEESFSDLLLLLSYRPYFPDGRIRTFAYQQQHLYSDCYLNGSMTCVDCHDPHSQKYRDIWGRPLVGRFSDGQCLDCHPSKAEEEEIVAEEPDSIWRVEIAGRPRAAAGTTVRINAHGRHRVGTPGSRCIDCHMPYLQEPDVGRRLRYSRSDHTIPIPRPRFDAMFGVENACVKCHRGRTFGEVQAQMRDWYGELKPPKDLIAGLLTARGVEDPAEAARLMLLPEDDYVALQFTNLSYYMLTYLRPDMSVLADEAVERLQRLAESDDLDLKALALASLHLARGDDPDVRSYLAGQLRGLGRKDRDIRRRWVWVLNFRGDAYSARGEYQRALAAYRKALEILPHDAKVLRNVGIGYSNLNDHGSALRYLRRSENANPNDVLTLVTLAFAMAAGGDMNGALNLYRRAIELNPWEPTSYFSLGNALLRGRRVENAIEAYRRALELDPGMAEAHFALGRIYYQLNRYNEAAAALRRGLEFDRGNEGARQLLMRLREEVETPPP